jgi:pimeloyl-ACP methyl ester carboxylesterase
MRYFTAGEGEPLVLVHGLGGAAANWVELAPALARRRRVLVPDLPGHGGSEPAPAAPNLAAYADRVALVMEGEGMLPAALVGHSFGGSVALRLAIRRPEAVTGIVLAGAAGISSGRRLAKAVVTTIGLVRPGRLVARARAEIAAVPWLRYPAFGVWGAVDPQALSPRAVNGFLEPQLLHTDTRSAGRALAGEDPGPELHLVRCPCLVLWGARDAMVPVADGFEYARRLRAPLRVIASCGHLLIAERPDACLDAIESFLDRIREVDELPVQSEPLG